MAATFFDWEGRPAITLGGTAFAIVGDTPVWEPVRFEEVIASGYPIPEAQFDNAFPYASRPPTILAKAGMQSEHVLARGTFLRLQILSSAMKRYSARVGGSRRDLEIAASVDERLALSAQASEAAQASEKTITTHQAGKRTSSMVVEDQAVAGTSDPARLRLLVKLFRIHPEGNTPDQNAQLAAAERLLKDEPS